MKNPILKSILISFLLTLAACQGTENKPVNEGKQVREIETPATNEHIALDEMKGAFAQTWKGQLNGKIPVFIHFTVLDSVLSGEITYLNTVSKQPIRILGELGANNSYRLLEMGKKGLITGIMNLKIDGEKCAGTWFSPQSRKEYTMAAVPSDSVIRALDLKTDASDVFGHYTYRYTKDAGNFGDFSIKKKSAETAIFQITGVHSAPGYNLAHIDETIVPFSGTCLEYKIPEAESCNFQVKFYKDFAQVKYTNGLCANGYFGHNASVEGLFLKVK